jgi:hypothetical protein
MDFDRGTVQRQRFDLDTDELGLLQACKDSVQHARFRPTAHPGTDSVPAPETFRQTAPLTVMFGNVQNGIEQLHSIDGHCLAAVAGSLRSGGIEELQ